MSRLFEPQPLCAAVLGWLLSGPAGAAGAGILAVSVTDADGEPIPDVVVIATPYEATDDAPPRTVAVMDQIDSAFVPHILVVQTGTRVSFPNNDSVSHHVYSFSDTKPFQLDLYRGNSHPPQVFDAPGLVVLGCNIHDGMIGYIYVTESPYFATTDARGVARMTGLPAGEYAIAAWSPRAHANDQPPPASLPISASDPAALTLVFTGKLRAAHGAHGQSLLWDHY